MEERLEDILEMLKRDGKVRVRDLSEKFNVSEGMIRKDLSKLEQCGNIKRTYGGAILERKIIHNDNTTSRIISNINEKEKIASLVMDEIEENDVIFMDISSTNYTVATMMAGFKKNITLITNMNRIAMAFDSIPNIDIIQIGGMYNKKIGGTAGAFTSNEIKKFKIDKAFIGAGGINIEDNFVSNFNLDEVSTKESIIKMSKKKYLITINDKFYNDGSYKFCELGDIDYIITDKKPEENIVDGLTKYNVKVIY
ncbi:DeoR/GlpR family DNA-binding transcription regulator [Clostridium sp. D46t1_190503_E9]|uniref:DeoR/GlpR family DNA-binding transcription regulator n=1 Tax=Clostridium sp. D46t1_190503_E9 TaxID=2787137 RepID=UPI001FACA7D9|nr:DeoR/GlpR family DNA-binding transcription regulator [Clostridium sp. D46t1_190503_E9]